MHNPLLSKDIIIKLLLISEKVLSGFPKTPILSANPS